MNLLGEVVASCEESEREVENYEDLRIGEVDLLDENLMQEVAVTDYKSFVLLSHLLLLYDSLERSKYSL